MTTALAALQQKHAPARWESLAACRPELHPHIDQPQLVNEWFGGLPPECHDCTDDCTDDCKIDGCHHGHNNCESNTGPSEWARAVCAGCPAIAECADRAVREKRKHGMFGGLGSNQRRPLWRLYRDMYIDEGTVHEYGPDCGCSYCSQLRQFTAPVKPVRPWNINGDGAECGHVSTYGRGCRCPACTLAMIVRARTERITRLDRHTNTVTIHRDKPVRCAHGPRRCRLCTIEAELEKAFAA